MTGGASGSAAASVQHGRTPGSEVIHPVEAIFGGLFSSTSRKFIVTPD
jgi:hypothetical protein